MSTNLLTGLVSDAGAAADTATITTGRKSWVPHFKSPGVWTPQATDAVATNFKEALIAAHPVIESEIAVIDRAIAQHIPSSQLVEIKSLLTQLAAIAAPQSIAALDTSIIDTKTRITGERGDAAKRLADRQLCTMMHGVMDSVEAIFGKLGTAAQQAVTDIAAAPSTPMNPHALPYIEHLRGDVTDHRSPLYGVAEKLLSIMEEFRNSDKLRTTESTPPRG